MVARYGADAKPSRLIQNRLCSSVGLFRAKYRDFALNTPPAAAQLDIQLKTAPIKVTSCRAFETLLSKLQFEPAILALPGPALEIEAVPHLHVVYCSRKGP